MFRCPLLFNGLRFPTSAPALKQFLLFGIFLLRKKPLAVIPRRSKYSRELNICDLNFAPLHFATPSANALGKFFLSEKTHECFASCLHIRSGL